MPIVDLFKFYSHLAQFFDITYYSIAESDQMHFSCHQLECVDAYPAAIMDFVWSLSLQLTIHRHYCNQS